MFECRRGLNYGRLKEVLGILCNKCQHLMCLLHVYEPRQEISYNVVCATSKVSDQTAHMRRLIRDFDSRLNTLLVLSYWLDTIWSF